MKALAVAIAQKLYYYYPELTIHSSRQVGGGNISAAMEINTSAGKFFVKFNPANRYPGMFESEKKGLELLASAHTQLVIPEPILCDTDSGGTSFLLMQFLETDIPEQNFWRNFGFRLALLHRNTSKQFGLKFNNYIGSLRQSNSFHSSWIKFFIEERLKVQFDMAIKNGFLNPNLQDSLDAFCKKLPELIPAEKPALIHGDLWAGNYMSGPGGRAAIFDPSCYFGHRESDIAMTTLFGGFPNDFYANYNEAYPMESGWRQRTDIFNLYPLLVHVNLFGHSYVSKVIDILRRYTK
ncbi:MAG: hypothetical protein A2W93_09175 [Bacteroidetes bacterium GWF2_43_63]|nr:MAG: hypothetical protein A2W94_05555 [Bacteroidetes bacterium GWE2_42_42]OFY54468.1 MAG: hypothetical protein A2W93_09175 [Bacteroidetes bacterium GWF2_43_63]HBG70416.1 ketosamine-3-kinase [Bacteroidales bacterium]HCB63467.1 ketosamine-3-kinase [Bacteroidales bacterium]